MSGNSKTETSNVCVESTLSHNYLAQYTNYMAHTQSIHIIHNARHIHTRCTLSESEIN